MPRFDAVYGPEGQGGAPSRVEVIEAPDAEAAWEVASGRTRADERLVALTPVDRDGEVFTLGGPGRAD